MMMMMNDLFPKLYRVRILSNISGHFGREGDVIQDNDDVVRVAFEEFWTRPEGMEPEEANDSGWYFLGEFVRIS